MKQVSLLFALYPCDEWWSDRHGATSECDCDEQLEGVFATPDSAKIYIGESVDENCANLTWEIEDNTESCGYRHEYAQAKESSGLVIWHIQDYNVHE
jgi:hypothetical protein